MSTGWFLTAQVRRGRVEGGAARGGSERSVDRKSEGTLGEIGHPESRRSARAIILLERSAMRSVWSQSHGPRLIVGGGRGRRFLRRDGASVEEGGPAVGDGLN